MMWAPADKMQTVAASCQLITKGTQVVVAASGEEASDNGTQSVVVNLAQSKTRSKMK